MKIVKLTSINKTWPYLRQTPNATGRWGDYQFVCDDALTDCYAWVVIGDLTASQEVVRCSRKRLLLVNDEPPTMRSYPEEFLSQFALILTCGGHQLKHPNIREQFPLLPWYYGVRQRLVHNVKKNSEFATYGELQDIKIPHKKKLISIVFSNVAFTQGHVERRIFVEKLKEHFGDALDIYGRGFSFIEDKADAIVDYKYHLVIENSVFPHYWTEKLADAFIGWSYPIYAGCPNIDEYFNPLSYSVIDTKDIENAIKIIEDLLRNNVWSQRVAEISESRTLILNKYNMFSALASIIDGIEDDSAPTPVKIKSIRLIVGRFRSFLRKIRAKMQFGLGITKILPFLRRI